MPRRSMLFRTAGCDSGSAWVIAVKSSTSFRYRAKERVGRTLEAIEILKRAWTGERFDFEGKHFNFKNARVLPKPISPKGPELLWGGMNPESIKRSATLDLGFACNLGSGEIRKYQEALRKLGKDPAAYSVVNTRQVYVADSEDQAWDEIAPGLMYQMELYGKWLDEGGIDTAGRYRPDAGALRRSAILGPPRRVIEQLEELIAQTPATEIALGRFPLRNAPARRQADEGPPADCRIRCG